MPAERVAAVKAFQRRAPCRLSGGAVLAGLHLKHRLSRDVDLFFDEESVLREIVRTLPDLTREIGIPVRIVRDARTHVRLEALARDAFEIDLVYEPAKPLESPERTSEDIIVESWTDLRASKIACLIERSEPRDLVDVMFLERAGHPPERDLEAAMKKDAGLDPGVLAWLLKSFPTAPLPEMIELLTSDELTAYRDALAERFRVLALKP